MHLYPATSSMHEPWFRHGLDAHSLMLVWQLGPGEREPVVGEPVTAGPWKDPAVGASLPPRLQAEPRAAPIPAAAGAHGGREAARWPQSPPPGLLLTTEALAAGAHIAAGHVSAGAAVCTRVGLTLVVVHVTVGPAPPGVTVTLVPAERTTERLTCARAPSSATVLWSDATEGLVHSGPLSPLEWG